MRAIVQDAYGSTEVLRLAEIARPEIAANEVLVKVVAAGMDRGTWPCHDGQALPDASPGFRVPPAQEPCARSGRGRHRCCSRVGGHQVQAR